MEDKNALAIHIYGVKKKYRLGVIGGRTLQEDLQSWWAKKRGRDDPNARLGVDRRLIGDTFWALNGIDLKVRRGERLGIIGANGAGKSTMLKLIARITAPTEGEIDIWGRVASLLEVGTGFHGEMTGRENIYMNGAILGMSRAEIDAKMEEIIEFSEVREFIDTPVKRYSSGMFVKLAFAVAANLNSEILIMDEVLAVGDMAFQNKCLEKMREVAENESKTILYVSHNMETIRNLCDRCIVMDQGKIIYDGDVESAIAAYMNHGLIENLTEFDVSGRSFADRVSGHKLAIRHIRILEKETPVYHADEFLKLRITVHVEQPLENVLCRTTFINENDTPIGSSWSNPLHFDHMGDQAIELYIPLSDISKGELYLSLGFYFQNDRGGNVIIDQVARFYRFEVIGMPAWKTKARGYVKFKDTEAVLINSIAGIKPVSRI